MAHILIVDDDDLVCGMLTSLMKRLGHDPARAATLEEAMALVRAEAFDVVFLDVNMPDGSGLDYLPAIRKSPGEPEVLIMTGRGDPEGAETAIKLGAWDYIEKGISSTLELQAPLDAVLQYRRGKGKIDRPVLKRNPGIIGKSKALLECMNLTAQMAQSDAPVLITGETGTGKEVFARALHENSPRSEASLVVVDCTALPENLVESLLFGYEKGSFTGATQAQNGLILQADRGTLFLDEIGELPLSAQKSFLRVLQERRFRPVGGKKEIESDFRPAAATNRDLEQMAREGRFREDLLFRLKAFTLSLPPLRDRPEDIPILADYYLKRFCRQYGIEQKTFSPDLTESLSAYQWPGNVRELINALERAIAAAWSEAVIYPKHLPPEIRIKVARMSVGQGPAAQPLPDRPQPARERFPTWKEAKEVGLSRLEKHYLEELMAVTDHDLARAMELSDLKRSRLYQLLKKHRLMKKGR